MGFLDNYKITSAEIAQNEVQSAPDTLTGTPQDNKRVFDKLAELIASKYNSMLNQISLQMYPVGAIYISTSSVNPSTYLGGTWASFGQGRTLVGVDPSDTDFNASNKTGGAKTHKLTIAEMPSHVHKYNAELVGSSGTARTVISGGNLGYSTSNAGGDGEHNNLQPYITTYMWRRTA